MVCCLLRNHLPSDIYPSCHNNSKHLHLHVPNIDQTWKKLEGNNLRCHCSTKIHFSPLAWLYCSTKSWLLAKFFFNATNCNVLHSRRHFSRLSLRRSSYLHSRSMILSAVTMIVGSFLTVMRVRARISHSCLPIFSDSFCTSAKYPCNIWEYQYASIIITSSTLFYKNCVELLILMVRNHRTQVPIF